MKLKQINVRYDFFWQRLTVYRHFEYEPFPSGIDGYDCVCGGSDMIFTAWPPWLWDKLTYWLKSKWLDFLQRCQNRRAD